MLNLFKNWIPADRRCGLGHSRKSWRVALGTGCSGARASWRLPRRAGVTFLEVLFASGIAVFGLVGIASLIAVGGRQASDANSWSEGQSAARYALSDFIVRGYNNSASWAAFNDQVNGGTLTSHFVAYNSMSSPLSRATTVAGVRTDNRHAVCIDPTFFFDATTADNITVNFPDNQKYRPGLFPYYQDNFNPDDPATPLNFNAGRLLRVSLRKSSGVLLPALVANHRFQFLDDLATTADSSDKTLPAERVFRFFDIGATDPALGQGLSNGEYSWFATLCPREINSPIEVATTLSRESLYTLSVVVCKRRDRAFYVPATGQQGPQGERVVTVTPSANFSGGSGGRVKLSAAHDPDNPGQDVSDSLRAGDWLMLCTQNQIATGSSDLVTICRWYRVIAVDAESTITGGNLWNRYVVLDGPDWIFNSSFPTQATLVSGVVTVVERVVPVL